MFPQSLAELPSSLSNITAAGAYEQEHATQLYSGHGVFIERFIFRTNLL